MVTYPLDEVLLATLVGVVCGADDWEEVEEIAKGALDWLRDFLPYRNGVPTAQTFRKVFRLLDAQALARGFAARASSVREARALFRPARAPDADSRRHWVVAAVLIAETGVA